MMIKMKMKNPPGLYVIHMLESDGVKRRALRARRLERPPISLGIIASVFQFIGENSHILQSKRHHG